MTELPSQNDDARYEPIRKLLQWVSSKTGLSFRGQEEHTIQILQRAISNAGDAGPMACRNRLERNPAQFDDLIGEMTVGETYFFRDESQFRIIDEQFLRRALAADRTDRQLRLWSAGCASGEEAWTLAMLLAECGLLHRAHVLATDISRPLLSRANAGVYRAWSLRGGARERTRNWLDEEGDEFRIRPLLRRHVSFEYLNLAEDKFPSITSGTVGVDLILCRNVMIYFDVPTIRKLAQRFFRCLRPGGWLVTGASDPRLADYAPFDVLSTAAGTVLVRPQETATPRTETVSLPESNRTPSAHRVDTPPSARRVDAPPPPAEAYVDSSVRNTLRQVETSTTQHVAAAMSALQQGQYSKVLALTEGREDHLQLCALRVRAMANTDAEAAERLCQKAAERHSTSVELHYLHAMLLIDLSRDVEAAAAARRVVFLDRELAVGHMAMGSVLVRTGDTERARRAFGNAARICRSMPPDQKVRLGDGETAGRMAESAARQLSLLEASDNAG